MVVLLVGWQQQGAGLQGDGGEGAWECVKQPHQLGQHGGWYSRGPGCLQETQGRQQQWQRAWQQALVSVLMHVEHCRSVYTAGGSPVTVSGMQQPTQQC